MCACMLSRFSHVRLCDPVDCSSPGSSVHGILQATVLKWFAMTSSRRSSWPRNQTCISCNPCIAGGLSTAEPPGKPSFQFCFKNVCGCVKKYTKNLTVLMSRSVLSCSVMSDSLWSHGLYPARLPCPWGFSRQEYWSGLPCPPPGNLPNPGIQPRSPALQADSLPSEPPEKPKNTGVGSLSLLQGIFSGIESSIVHWRWILYQVNYQGSPCLGHYVINAFLYLLCFSVFYI